MGYANRPRRHFTHQNISMEKYMEFKMIPCPAHDLELTWEKDESLSFCDDEKSIILIGYRIVLTPYEIKWIIV